MVASLNELKNLIKISPSSPNFLNATPNTMANTTRPRIFIPSWSVPKGTCRNTQDCQYTFKQQISKQFIEYNHAPFPLLCYGLHLCYLCSPACSLSHTAKERQFALSAWQTQGNFLNLFVKILYGCKMRHIPTGRQPTPSWRERSFCCANKRNIKTWHSRASHDPDEN